MPQYFIKQSVVLYVLIQEICDKLNHSCFFFKGIIKIFRYDTTSEKCDPKKSEPQTTLARRRAEKQKLKGNPDSIKGNKK